MGSVLKPPAAYVPSNSPFEDWSPLQLAAVCGVRIDLRNFASGQRVAYLEGDAVSHSEAWARLSDRANLLGIDPANAPQNAPRALINGKEQ